MSIIHPKCKTRLFIQFMAIALALSMNGLASAKDTDEWEKYQRDFKKFCQDSDNPALADLAPKKPVLREIALPEAEVNDACTSCHLGIDNPLFKDAPQPFTAHPGKTFEQHTLDAIGCTLCHQGNGEGTTVETAHGTAKDAPSPLTPTPYLQSACARCHETSYGLEGAEKLELGRLLFTEKGCYACHAARGLQALPKVGSPLDAIGTKVANPSWLTSWLKEPAKLRSQTLMPNFRLSDAEIGDLSAYLVTLTAQEPPKPASLAGASTEQGERLFLERGCRGCHSPDKNEASASARVPNLSGIGLKVTPEWLMAWLEDPRAYNPETLMPKTELTVEERRDLSAYLLTLKSTEDIVQPGAALNLAAFDAKNGEKLVETLGCYGCHALRGFAQKPMPGADVAEVAGKTLADLPFGDAKIAHTKWDWVAARIETPKAFDTADAPARSPEFAFEKGEVEALTTFYLNNDWPKLPAQLVQYASHKVRALQEGDRIVTAYNCRGCHVLEDEQKTLLEDRIELKSMLPPRLVGEGARVLPQWFCEYMRKPTVLRPWLTLRMPEFALSHEDHENLARYFAMTATDAEDTFPYVVTMNKETIPQEEIEMGEYRVRTDKCIQCHPATFDGEVPEDLSLEDLSIDLMLTKSRLRFEWVKDFLRDPDEYVGADTKMPFVYYDPDGKPKIPDPEMWIDLSAKFLMVMEELPEPLDETLSEIRPGSDKDWTSTE